MDFLDFFDLLKNRYSVRNFSDKRVAREDIEKCVLAANLAPSACNKKPWRFVVVDDISKRDEIAAKAFDLIVPNSFVRNAPCIIVACAKTDFIVHKLAAGYKNIDYDLLDMGAAIENFVLEATFLGLGTCWLGWFNEKNIRDILKIPKNLKIVSLIVVGYPSENESKKVKDLGKYKTEIFYNSF